jgi:ATP adenylyltransferase
MKLLWAPWRMDYILRERKGEKCIFCRTDRRSDRKRLILLRTPFSLVMMNRYPYSYGHLMVSPIRHTRDLSRLRVEEMTDLFLNVGRSVDVLKAAFHPQGFNVGANLGDVAGAGICQHLHVHVVPRWKGDINYMPMIAEVRVIPEHLDETYRRLLPYFRNG